MRMADDFITIPVIEIEPGWSVEDLETIEDCEDAHIKVSAIIAEIEYQMDIHDAKQPIDQNPEWYAKAKRALKYKRIASQCINNTRARLAKKERLQEQKTFEAQLIELVKTSVEREQFLEWVSIVKDRIHSGRAA